MQAKDATPKPLTILQLESGMNWGGQEERILREMDWLNNNGHRAILACPKRSAIGRRAMEAGLDVRPVSMRMNFDIPGLLKLVALVWREKPDILHAHSSKDAWFALWLRWLGVPVVRSRHISLPLRMPYGRKLIYRYGSDRLIASAGFIAANMRESIGVPGERVEVIGECVDTAEFHPGDGSAFRRELGIAPDAPLFAVIGMLRGEKGQMFFARAAREVLLKRPDVRFVIVGGSAGSTSSAKFEMKLKEFLRTHFPANPEAAVRMTGFRRDIPVIMRAMDCLVVPSSKDAQTLVIPQAFATGKPVIGSRVGGIPELVQEGINGLLVEPKNPAALAEAILKVAGNLGAARQWGQAGLRLALNELTTDHKMSELLACYRRAITARRAR